MKSIRVIAVLALLVLFPLVSYIYLRQGYYFRLDALKELEPKVKIDKFDYIEFDSETNYSADDLRNKVTLIYDNSNPRATGMMQPIFEQFSHRELFQVFAFNKDSVSNVSLRNEMKSPQFKVVSSDYIWDKEIVLIDTSATIRNYYQFDSSSFLSLGQHIPIIIPRVQEQDIVMKGQKAEN